MASREYFTSPIETDASGVVFVFDYDGTLSPIVERPDDARMRPRTRELLVELARRAPCCVVSGRARADVLARLEGPPLERVVGNHGIEWGRGDEAALEKSRALVAEWVRALRASAELAENGVEIEDKGLSLSLHTRRAKDPKRAERLARQAAESLSGPPCLIDGKAVLNVLPPGAVDKGEAVLRIARELGARTVFFIGDDVTDEHAFVLTGRELPFRFVSVRIGEDPATRAEFHVRDQRDIDSVIERWLEVARAQAPAPTGRTFA